MPNSSKRPGKPVLPPRAQSVPLSMRPESLLAAARTSGRRANQVLLTREGGCVAADAFAAALGITLRALQARLRRGSVLASPSTGSPALVFPLWQIGPDRRILRGLPRLLCALRQDGKNNRACMRFLLRTDVALGGARPLDLLRAGRLDEVLATLPLIPSGSHQFAPSTASREAGSGSATPLSRNSQSHSLHATGMHRELESFPHDPRRGGELI